MTEDVDPAELKRELTDIKSAMGLDEWYPGQRRIWLGYGFCVFLFSVAIQALFFVPLPGWAYITTWCVFAFVVVAALWLLARRVRRGQSPETAPDWWVFVGGLTALLLVLSSVSSPLVANADIDGVVRGAYFFALVIALGGLGFLIVGNVLKAYRIRRRDRWVFYAGGLWMLGFAAMFPNVDVLRYVGYIVFGILSLVHALVSYSLLTHAD